MTADGWRLPRAHAPGVLPLAPAHHMAVRGRRGGGYILSLGSVELLGCLPYKEICFFCPCVVGFLMHCVVIYIMIMLQRGRFSCQEII